ncbi:MAG: hypothetical protein P4L84_37235 [Isosphaeraceae bacterium]|nr:hypothetical protein [Isosphaeraceae bacterium]
MRSVELKRVVTAKGGGVVRVRLTDNERALLVALLKGPVAGVPLAKLPERVGWRVERVAEVLSPLIAGKWVEVVEPRVRLAAWAAVWLDHQATASGRRWRPIRAVPRYPELGFDPVDEERGREHSFVLTGSDAIWREIHRRNCDCCACREGEPPSGTRPRPPSCATCKGRPLPPLWECLRCGRGGRDRHLPPLPTPRRPAPKTTDDGLKGGRG